MTKKVFLRRNLAFELGRAVDYNRGEFFEQVFVLRQAVLIDEGITA